MAKPLTISQIQNRLPEYIQIIPETYVNTMSKATFVDAEYGEWKAIVNNVLRGSEHPERGRQKIRESLTMPVVDILKCLPPELTIDTSTYVNITTPCRFIDSDFGEWWTKPMYVVYDKTGHPARANNLRCDQVTAEAKIRTLGYTLVSEYTSANKKVQVKCIHCGTIRESIYRNILGSCQNCRNQSRNKELINKVQEICQKEGWEILGIDAPADPPRHRSKVRLCKGDYQTTTSISRLLNGRNPFYVPKYNTTIIRRKLVSFGYELLSEYINERSVLQLKCPEGHFFDSCWNLFQAGSRCPHCALNARLTIGEIQRRCLDRNLEYLSGEYHNVDSLFSVKCLKDGAMFETSARKLSWGPGCPKCRESESSQTQTKVLNVIRSHYNGRWISNDRSLLQGREIDIFLPELNVGIEVNGIYYHSDQVANRPLRDKAKQDLAEDLGIDLLSLYEDEVDLPTLETFIASLFNNQQKTETKLLTETQAQNLAEDLYGTFEPGPAIAVLDRDQSIMGMFTIKGDLFHSMWAVIPQTQILMALKSNKFSKVKVKIPRRLRLLPLLNGRILERLPPERLYVVGKKRTVFGGDNNLTIHDTGHEIWEF